ncbi:MAG: ankyrin repeat domain-containing protein, partial [Elusimicrobiota bacterium]
NGANPNFQDATGCTALMLARFRKHDKISKLLIEYGANKKGTNQETLMRAVWENSVETAKSLINKSVDVNIKGKYDLTPLMWAAISNSSGVAKVLIENGADINTSRCAINNGETALFFAIEYNSTETIKILLKMGADINITDKDGMTPLMYAINNNNQKLTKLLLDKGADFDAHSYDGDSALTLAVIGNHPEIVKMLLAKGANINTRDKSGNTTLMLAVKYNLNKMAELLAINGADVNASSGDESPAAYAIKQNNLELLEFLISKNPKIVTKENKDITLKAAIDNNSQDAAMLLMLKGADIKILSEAFPPYFREPGVWGPPGIPPHPNANLYHKYFEMYNFYEKQIKPSNIDKHSKTLLWATKYNATLLMKSAVKKGAIVNAKDMTGATPLMYAAENNSIEMTKFLLSKHANPNAIDNNGRTALIRAAGKNAIDTIRLLLEKKVDTSARDKYGKTALMTAYFYLGSDSYDLLKSSGSLKESIVGPKTLIWAAWKNNVELVKSMIKNGKNVNEKDDMGITPLMWAIWNDSSGVVKTLIENGANVNGQYYVGNPESRSDFESENGCTRRVKPIETIYKEKYGWTPLIWAISKNNIELIKLLLSNGANVNDKDHFGYTPLIWAAWINSIDIVRLLLNSGADVNIKPYWWSSKLQMPFGSPQNTALDIATKNNNSEMISLLKAHEAVEIKK